MCAYYPESKVEIHGFEARHYDSIMNIITFGRYSKLMKQAIELMNIQQSDKILDFGAGTGKNACLMAKYISHNGEILGLDISDEMIYQFEKRCKKFPNVKILKRRIDQPIDYNGYFDKVFISFVLHGFPQDIRMQIIKNALVSLKTGGEFFILDYDHFSLDDMPFYLKIPFELAECKYAFDFIEQNLKKMLEVENFSIIEKYSLFNRYIMLMKAKKKMSDETEKISKNSLILLIDIADNSKRYLISTSLGKFSTKRGQIDLTELIGKDFGTIVKSHLGRSYAAVRPTFYDRIMRGIRRQTQIVYPKDSGYISLWLGLRSGMKVFECGTGSGAMTSIIANAIAPDGTVITYERDEKFFELAKSNIDKLGFSDNVKIFNRELARGIDETFFDAMFIDVREPWEYIDTIWSALSGGAPIAFVLPTTNQVSMLLKSLRNENKFIDVQVAEILLRFYKPVPARFRPEDRMLAHTTYLIMARKILT